MTDDELKEEIICDAMSDVIRRTGLLKQIGRKNSSLIERVISWAKLTLDRFTDWFHSKERGLTTEQRAKMYDVFGKIARQIEDGNGNKIFRYNNRTHEVELADGRELPETKKAVTEGEQLSPKETVKQKLLPLVGKPIKNKSTGIVALINIKQINEMLSNRAVNKSINNGFSQEQHLEATGNIKKLYEDANLTLTRPDEKKTPGSQGLKSIKIFHCDTKVAGEGAVAKLTVKESFQHGHRVYSIELEELSKPAELENRTGIDSSADSKGSTQKGNMSSSHYAEKPSIKNIPQGAEDSNTNAANDALIVFGGEEAPMARITPETKKSVNPKADNKRITQKARELLKAVGLENRRPKSEEKLGKIYGQMESDGTFTAEIKLKDAEKLEHLKRMADEIGATYNEDTKNFHFNDIESLAVFFKTARTAFHDKTSSQNNYDRQVSGTAGVELPEGYRTETGKLLQESNVRDFVVKEDGNKDFGEITPDIERETNGLVKAAPIRLQVDNGDFGYIHINIRHLQDIKQKALMTRFRISTIFYRISTGFTLVPKPVALIDSYCAVMVRGDILTTSCPLI